MTSSFRNLKRKIELSCDMKKDTLSLPAKSKVFKGIIIKNNTFIKRVEVLAIKKATVLGLLL